MEHGTEGFESSRRIGRPDAAEEAKEKVSELTRTTRERAMSTIDQQKQQVSGLLDRLADTMASDRIGGYGADYARRGAEYLRRTSADQMLRSARSELRSRPGVLLSACFVAGLAVGRLLRRDRGRESRYGRSFAERDFREREPWRDFEHQGPSQPTWPAGRGLGETQP